MARVRITLDITALPDGAMKHEVSAVRYGDSVGGMESMDEMNPHEAIVLMLEYVAAFHSGVAERQTKPKPPIIELARAPFRA